jgi:hypothetical protein
LPGAGDAAAGDHHVSMDSELTGVRLLVSAS